MRRRGYCQGIRHHVLNVCRKCGGTCVVGVEVIMIMPAQIAHFLKVHPQPEMPSWLSGLPTSAAQDPESAGASVHCQRKVICQCHCHSGSPSGAGSLADPRWQVPFARTSGDWPLAPWPPQWGKPPRRRAPARRRSLCQLGPQPRIGIHPRRFPWFLGHTQTKPNAGRSPGRLVAVVAYLQ